MDNYRDATSRFPDGFGMNWSIYEWEDAHEGDLYVMYCTTGPMRGIVFSGHLLCDPYAGGDWAGKGKPRFYADISCNHAIAPGEASPISVDVLKEKLPGVNWDRGHSGELLRGEDAWRMLGLIEDHFGIIYDRGYGAEIDDEE